MRSYFLITPLLFFIDSRAALAERTQTVSVEAEQCSALLHLPARNCLSAALLPLVIVFHGEGDNSQSAERMSGMSALTARINLSPCIWAGVEWVL